MEYKLDVGCWNSVFAVPCDVVDQYIRLAGEGAMKIMLFMLRHGGKSFSEEELMDALGIKSRGELEDALLFWVQRGMLKHAEIESPEDVRTFADAAPKRKTITAEQLVLGDALPQPTQETSSAKPVGANTLYFTSGDIAERIRTDKEIAGLFSEAEKLYGRSLRPKEMQTVISLTDVYGLPAIVAIMLLKYCFRIQKGTAVYINSVAHDWSEDNINTFELADMRISELERKNSNEEKLRKAMELDRKFIKKEREYIESWTCAMGFSVEMIMLAYERAVMHVNGKNPFDYMNGILTSWHKDGITAAEQVEQKDKEYRGKKKPAESSSNPSDSSFDVDDIMKQIRSKYNNT